MSLKLTEIEISAKLPKINRSMPVYKVKRVSLDERQQAIKQFQEILHIGKVLPVDMQDSLHLANKAGEIQYYRSSGALWVHSFVADDKYPDERRPWKVEQIKDDEDPENSKLVLSKEEQKKLAERTEELFEKTKLLSKQAYFSGVELDQVTRLDEKGKEVERFSGEANVRFLYKLDDIPVEGGGAKSYAFYNPGESEHELTGIYHCWRETVDARTIQMVTIEEILERAISQDRELVFHHKKRSLIQLNQVELVYFTMPPYKYQDYAFPSIHIIGSVIPEDKELRKRGFEFARFYNAAAPESYAKAELYADYLLSRP